MKKFIGFIIFVDLIFLAGCLVMPRSGMEAMGSVFILIPLAGLHLLVGIAACIIELHHKRWKYPVYFTVMTCLMAFMGHLYSNLKPTYRPLHRVLVANAIKQKSRLAEFKDGRILATRRLLERYRDEDHADLCRAVDYPLNVEQLAAVLVRKPDLASPCARLGGQESLPLIAVLKEGYERRFPGDKEDRQTRHENMVKAVDLLLINGADPNSQDEEGNTPLHWSLLHNDEKLVSLLINHGACTYLKNNEGRSAMSSYAYSKIGKIIQKAAEDPQMILNCPQVFQKLTTEKMNAPSHSVEDREVTKPLRNEALCVAAQSGNIDKVVTLLAEGADPNGTDRRGKRPLHLATTCRKEMPAIVEILLTAGADIDGRDRRGSTPLMAAARNHCLQIMTTLLKKGADATLSDEDGVAAMHWIARWQADTIGPAIDALLSAGAKIDARDKWGRSPLMMTAYSPNTGDDALTVFFEKGADPDTADQVGNTLMHLLAVDSSKKERIKGVSRLIEAGATIDLYNKDQMTPLMLAVKRRKTEIAKLLLKSGASPNVVDRSRTPLLHTIISCQQEKLALLDILIEAGCEVDIRNEGGQTALHRAMLNHLHVKCLAPIEKLLQAGAHPNALDKNGMAPLHNIAQWEKKDPAEALKLMKKFGADIDIRDHQGMTSLLRTAQFGSGIGVMQALLDAGADPGVADNRGNTLLHCVAMNTKTGGDERLQVALKGTIDLDSRNQTGHNALELALKYKNENVVIGLIKAGAKKTSPK